MKNTLTAAVTAIALAASAMTASANPWENQANSELGFLPQGQVSAGVASEVQGENAAILAALGIATIIALHILAIVNPQLIEDTPGAQQLLDATR